MRFVIIPYIYYICSFVVSVALTKITPLAGATAASTIHTFPGELEELQSVLHFPEEVALRITDAEYQLFYQVKFVMIAFNYFQ